MRRKKITPKRLSRADIITGAVYHASKHLSTHEIDRRAALARVTLASLEDEIVRVSSTLTTLRDGRVREAAALAGLDAAIAAR